MKPYDLTCKKFGRLTPIRILSHNPIVWECLCDCGVTKQLGVANLSSGHSQSCGCLKVELAKERSKKRPFEWLYNIVKNQKRWVDLTYDEFLEFTRVKECHYCGVSIHWHEYAIGGGRVRRKGHTNLDRKNNTIGYTKQNVAVCCPRCNAGKSDKFSYEEWVEVGKVLKALREQETTHKMEATG